MTFTGPGVIDVVSTNSAIAPRVESSGIGSAQQRQMATQARHRPAGTAQQKAQNIVPALGADAGLVGGIIPCFQSSAGKSALWSTRLF